MNLENVVEIAKKNPSLTFTIKDGEVTSISEYKDLLPEEEKLLSIIEVAKLFGITRATVLRWTIRRYLIPVLVQGRKKHKLTEVRKILNGDYNDRN
jgi:hypothetical protein